MEPQRGPQGADGPSFNAGKELGIDVLLEQMNERLQASNAAAFPSMRDPRGFVVITRDMIQKM